MFIGTVVNGVQVNSSQASQYDGKVPGRTPKVLLAVQPSFDLPNNLGLVYLRYRYVGKVFADAGNGLALPAYGTLSLGGSVDISKNINLNVSVENVTNELGLTEGNPAPGSDAVGRQRLFLRPRHRRHQRAREFDGEVLVAVALVELCFASADAGAACI